MDRLRAEQPNLIPLSWLLARPCVVSERSEPIVRIHTPRPGFCEVPDGRRLALHSTPRKRSVFGAWLSACLNQQGEQ